MLILYFLLSLLGLVVGSFLTMLSYRLPRGLSILGRSVCPLCHKQISWYQNIPVFYFILSGGKCGFCKEAISLRYPLVEIITALFFLISAYLWGLSGSNLVVGWNALLGNMSLPFFFLLTIFFLLLTIIDFEFQILPDKILFLLMLLTALVLLLSHSPTVLFNLFVGFSVFIFFIAIYLLTQKRGMGFGDVKMSFILSSLLGFPNILIWLFLSFLSGAVVGLFFIAIKKSSFGKSIPFGPFLLISAWITFFFGDMILGWYLVYN